MEVPYEIVQLRPGTYDEGYSLEEAARYSPGSGRYYTTTDGTVKYERDDKGEGSYVTLEPVNYPPGGAYQEPATGYYTYKEEEDVYIKADPPLTPKNFSHFDHPVTSHPTQLSAQVCINIIYSAYYIEIINIIVTVNPASTILDKFSRIPFIYMTIMKHISIF